MSRHKTKIIVAAAILALPVMFLVGSALAQTGGTADKTGTDYRQAFKERLAAVLGVDTGRLDAAFKQAGGDVINLAEENGDLTGEQADRMRQRVDKNEWPVWGKGPMGPGHGFGRHFGRHGFGHGGMKGMGDVGLDAAATALGMTRDDLIAEIKDGKTLGEIADARGVDRDKVQDALIAAHKEKLDEAVKNEDLTQKQADRMLEGFKSVNVLDKPLGRCWGHGKTYGEPPASGTSTSL